MGHCVGFGCTEENLLYQTIGCKERGDPSQGTFRYATGDGWVKAKEGHYDDAIHNKQNSVKVMIFWPFQGFPETSSGKCYVSMSHKIGQMSHQKS